NQLAVSSYEEDGILFGPYYEGNATTAIYNASFRPFESPVPFMFVRHGVVGDWKFFLDDDQWLDLWVHRHAESGTRALAEEVRRLPWRSSRGGRGVGAHLARPPPRSGPSRSRSRRSTSTTYAAVSRRRGGRAPSSSKTPRRA